jgi:hypothetical protein
VETFVEMKHPVGKGNEFVVLGFFGGVGEVNALILILV